MGIIPVRSIHSFLSEDWMDGLDLAAGADDVVVNGSEEWDEYFGWLEAREVLGGWRAFPGVRSIWRGEAKDTL